VHHMGKLRPLALLFLRVGLGVIFIYNGYPKLFGRRLEHIDEMIHINHLPAYFVYIAFVLEAGGGALLIAGLSVLLSVMRRSSIRDRIYL